MVNDNLTYTISADVQHAGQRVDKFLAASLPDLTRTRLQQLMEQGCVTCNGSLFQNPSAKVREGQTFFITIPDVIDAIPLAQDIPLDILYEDEDVVVINKSAGMVVHPAPGNYEGTLVNALLFHCGETLSGINGVARPGIVHRLDKGTSGLLAVAKNDIAHQALAKQLSDRTMSRVYYAVVWGVPFPGSGRIEGNIARSSQNRKKMTVVKQGGKEAITNYKVIRSFGQVASLVECRLETGRTHQIRVHMTSLGYSLMGDPVYGRPLKKCAPSLKDFLKGESWGDERVALHAIEQTFIHPKTKQKMTFNADLPGDIRQLIDVIESLI